ncbi:peroxiredoxin family protein [Rhodoferax sp.]|uniref:peroxiredoxin family protein n=1 Tax=Rhodoferax sp. TaxID=50421 RepID=UPI00276AAAE4|nr:redoxin domain-containing protein [Rhodoferax sp.]
MPNHFEVAPALHVSQWLNAKQTISLAELRGRVVVLHAFQMLCPGCVAHGNPQAIRIHHAFDRKDVMVLGLHAVFEHHAVMGPKALEVFMHEYRIPFPVGVDMASADSDVPLTMHNFLVAFSRSPGLRHRGLGTSRPVPAPAAPPPRSQAVALAPDGAVGAVLALPCRASCRTSLCDRKGIHA